MSSGLRVPKGSSLIEPVQALHAANGNGLCPLDFRNPGEFCANTDMCKMVCLVCGKATIDGTDPAFQLFYDLFGGSSSSDDDQTGQHGAAVTAKYEIHEAMQEHGLVWTDEQWDLPIHKECSKKTACKCVVAKGTTVCPKHQRSLVSPPVQPVQAIAPVVDRLDKKVLPVATTSVVDRVLPMKQVVMTKATWLPTPSLTTRGSDSGFPAGGGPAGPRKIAKPVKNSQAVKNAKVEAMASKCAKINTWTATHPTNKGLVNPVTLHDGAGQGDNSFSLRKHNEKFDIRFHGAFRLDGVDGYKRGDGVFVPTTSDVNTLNEDGTLTPLAPR